MSLFALMSCTIMTVKPNQPEIVTNIMEDFLTDHLTYHQDAGTGGMLVFVEMNNNQLHKITIQDYPMEHLYDDIRNNHQLQESIVIGLYNNKPTKLVLNERDPMISAFIEVSQPLFEKARYKPVLSDKKGNELAIEFDAALVEYEPALVSEYLVKQHTKTIRLPDGRVLTEVY